MKTKMFALRTQEMLVTDQIEKPQEVSFHYIKSNLFRVVHVDGAIGGASPRGLIQINFYSERQPIPKQTVHALVDDKLGEEIRERRISRDGIVREIEVGAMLDLNGAMSLYVWLEEHIKILQSVKSEGQIQ